MLDGRIVAIKAMLKTLLGCSIAGLPQNGGAIGVCQAVERRVLALGYEFALVGGMVGDQMVRIRV
jgi:hypothetical protein